MEIDNTISSAPAPATPPPAAAPPAAPANDHSAVLQAQIDQLKGQVAESQRVAEFWANRAMETPAPAAEPEPEPQPAADEEVDVLDAITSKGAKGLDEILARRGYVRADQIKQIRSEIYQAVDTKAAQLSTEQELLQAYPDLANRQSEFFAATASYYGDLVKQGVPQAAAMRIAAQQAELAGIKSGKLKTTSERRESDRQARIRAQAGEGNSRAAQPADDEDEELTAEEKHICDAMGVTYDAYKARAKAGVRVSMRTGEIPRGGRK